MNQSRIQMLDIILEVLELLMISFLYLVSMEYRLEIQTISYGPYDLSMVYKLQIKKSRSSDQKFIFSLLRILILNSGCIEGARYGIFVLYGNFTSKDAIGNYEAFQVVKLVKILSSKVSKRGIGINEWPLWGENTIHFQQFQSTKTSIYTVKHLRVTSMLMTDVGDQMCW